jgi:hypothetical protein
LVLSFSFRPHQASEGTSDADRDRASQHLVVRGTAKTDVARIDDVVTRVD